MIRHARAHVMLTVAECVSILATSSALDVIAALNN